MVKNNYTGCHCADCVNTQRRNAKSTTDFWPAKVTKMIKADGASLNDTDAPKIIEYLAATYERSPASGRGRLPANAKKPQMRRDVGRFRRNQTLV